jgi:hypothetical protein
LDDLTLIDTCERVELLTAVNRERLRHVNYMRNHASAAHPNQSELTGQEMTAWLSNCLRYAIIAKPDHAVIVTKQLLNNVRTVLIPEADIPVIAADFDKFTTERIDDLLWTLFGIYVDPSQKADSRTNIAHLAPYVWSLASEDRRFQVGARHEHFIKQADQQRKVFADEFLAHVDGQQYRSEDVLAGELLDKLRGKPRRRSWPQRRPPNETAVPPSGIHHAHGRLRSGPRFCWMACTHRESTPVSRLDGAGRPASR